MPQTSDRALCLRRLDYSETSQILSIFSRQIGLIRVIAKGAKRTTKAGDSRFDGGLDLLELGDAVFIHAPERDLSTLTEWSLVDSHLALRSSLRALYLAQYAAELVSILFEEHDPHPEVFDDLLAVFAELPGPHAEESFLAFELRCLYIAGLLPEFFTCVSCGKPPVESGNFKMAFSPRAGQIICHNCFPRRTAETYPDARTVDPRLIRLFRTLIGLALPREYNTPLAPLAQLRLPRLTRAQTDPANRVLLAHLRTQTSHLPRLAPWIFTTPPPVTPALPHIPDTLLPPILEEPFLALPPAPPVDPAQIPEAPPPKKPRAPRKSKSLPPPDPKPLPLDPAPG